MPWTTTRAFFVRRTATSGTSRLDAHREFRGFFDCLRGVRPNGPQDLFRGRFVHSLDPSDDGHFGVHLVDRLLHARRDRIRLRDPAEDVDQDYGRIRLDQEFEGLLDLRRIVRAAEVQEDAAPPSLKGQGIERGHRQARAVRDDADVPVQLDEDDALVVRLLLQRRPSWSRFAYSGWRYSALSSITSFASPAITRPSPVTMRGLISTSSASSFRKSS